MPWVFYVVVLVQLILIWLVAYTVGALYFLSIFAFSTIYIYVYVYTYICILYLYMCLSLKDRCTPRIGRILPWNRKCDRGVGKSVLFLGIQ